MTVLTHKPLPSSSMFLGYAGPWCYIGSKRLEQAIKSISNADVKTEWHAFLLDPTYHEKQPMGEPVDEYLSAKFGPDFAAMKDRVVSAGRDSGAPFASFTHRANTLPGHRLVALARQHGKTNETEALLWNLYYEKGVNISDPKVVIQAGKDLELPNVEDFILGTGGLKEVDEDLMEARKRRITGVPAFFISAGDSDTYYLSGAQPPELFAKVFHEVLSGNGGGK